ncbi:M20/M25/M40 family metallo-hydrolase [Kitasatospora sp. NPDC057936]|uniref:M20/M25/M40 family metallo-hydrolase n=1 Tax=Kitasatospora sp. NPDC057936 TaxID=3346283 RepID=UPI0036DF7519
MRRWTALFTTLLTAIALAGAATPASADDGDSPDLALTRGVTTNGIMTHVRALQRIADHNDGLRASGTDGYDAAADYVERTLRHSGYDVQEQQFTIPYYRELSPAALTEVSPNAVTIKADTFVYSGSADVTGTVVPTTNVVVPPTPQPSSASGCAPGDFPPVPAGAVRIALIQRGGCGFAPKTANAQAAGYKAVMMFNEGQPGRDGALTGTIGGPTGIPVVGLDYASGLALYQAATSSTGATVHLVTNTEQNPNAETRNIIAETRGGDPNHVVLVHAELDALPSGPGINENGTGVATALEIARQLARLHVPPHYKVRFAFFGAEETRAFRDATGAVGLQGSLHYVDTIGPAEVAKIFAAVHLDSIGSPNYTRYVFDGSGPAGSDKITKLFTDAFAARGLATDPHPPTTFDGDSDYGPLMNAGVPTSGLFGGAAEVKTPDQAKKYGGTAGQENDPCFHQACDTIKNVNRTAVGDFGAAAWTVVRELAAKGLS